MQAEQVLKSSILDIVFDGRNKEYGAYELRKHYNNRLLLSLGGTAILTGSLFVIFLLVNQGSSQQKQVMYVKDVQLESVVEEKKAEIPPPPPPPAAAPQKVEVTKFTPPR